MTTTHEHIAKRLWQTRKTKILSPRCAFFEGVRLALKDIPVQEKSIEELKELNRALQLTIKEILTNQGILK
jgi:hypothetical protein